MNSMHFTPLRSGSPFLPSIYWTQPGTHPHLDAASIPYHPDPLTSQAIGSMTSILYLPQLPSLRQYQACLHSPLQEGEWRRDKELHWVHISPYHHGVHTPPYHQSRTAPSLLQAHSTQPLQVHPPPNVHLPPKIRNALRSLSQSQNHDYGIAG